MTGVTLPNATIVVPVLNGAHILPVTVTAVLAQPVARIVYVDDGSTDGTADVLASVASGDARVEVVRLGENRGRAAARNVGAARGAGDALLFLDADVAPEAGYAHALVEALGHPDVVAAVGALGFSAANPHDPYHRYLASPGRGAGGRGPAPWRHFLAGVSAVRRDAFRAAGGFPERVRYGEDLALACALARAHPRGLWREDGAKAELYDLGDLDTALAKVRAFARGLEDAEAVCPEVMALAGLGRLASQAPSDRAAVALAAWRAPASLVRRALPWLPAPVQTKAVRYLLGHTLARAAHSR